MWVQYISAGTGVLSQAFTVEKDCQVVGFSASKASFIGYDGSAALTDMTGPTTTALKKTVIAYNAGSSVPAVFGYKITLIQGETIYLISAGGTACLLFLEDIPS